MKNKIISHLKSRGLDERGEEKISMYIDTFIFLGKLIMIPLCMLGIFSLGYFMSLLIQIILNF